MELEPSNVQGHVKNKGKAPAFIEDRRLEPTTHRHSEETCVICLDQITEQAIALPCKHDQFDFACLGTWVQQSHICPLCKAEVSAIRYNVGAENKAGNVFYLPKQEAQKQRPATGIRWRGSRASQHYRHSITGRRHRSRQDWGERPTSSVGEDRVLQFRKQVYREQMYSAYIGTNRISRYRNITPESFTKSPNLVARAKTFIRRELQVFDFLRPSTTATSSSPSSSSSPTTTDRRANNAEFLLEYIIGILKSIDLKGSTGQAQELLQDFLGRENARIFLHELENWLRSPYESLDAWDRHVQYRTVGTLDGRGGHSPEG